MANGKPAFLKNGFSFSKIFLGAMFLGLLFGVLPMVAKADAVTGYAWSDTIGWIQFNPTYGGVQYTGYDTNRANGKLTGYAWSDNIGWIKFDGLSGYPSGFTNDYARTDANGKLLGWARACAGTVNNSPNQNLPGDCSTMTPRTDGWDGWIRLGDSNNASYPNYGVKVDLLTGDFSQYAWGSDVVGWVSFNCEQGGSALNDICGTSNYKVTIGPKFPELTLKVTVTNNNNAQGYVTFGTNINCGYGTNNDCQQIYTTAPQTITLSANTTSGLSSDYFVSWSGVNCEGGNTGSACKFTLSTGIASVTATFNNNVPQSSSSSSAPPASSSSSEPPVSSSSSSSSEPPIASSSSSEPPPVGGPYNVTIIKGSGAGTGTVGVDGDSTCYMRAADSSCTKPYPGGSDIYLEAYADNGMKLNGWSGDCSGSAKRCDLFMNGDKTVVVDFALSDDPAPAINYFYSDPSTIKSGGTSVIHGKATNVSSCVLASRDDANAGGWSCPPILGYCGQFGAGWGESYWHDVSSDFQWSTTLSTEKTYQYELTCRGIGSYDDPNQNIEAQTSITVINDIPASSSSSSEPEMNFTLEPQNNIIFATIVEGLSADSSEATISLEGDSTGNINMSAILPSGVNNAQAVPEFSSDGGDNWQNVANFSLNGEKDIKFRVRNIAGSTLPGTYPIAIQAKDNTQTRTATINLQVEKITTQWQEI